MVVVVGMWLGVMASGWFVEVCLVYGLAVGGRAGMEEGRAGRVVVGETNVALLCGCSSGTGVCDGTDRRFSINSVVFNSSDRFFSYRCNRGFTLRQESRFRLVVSYTIV